MSLIDGLCPYLRILETTGPDYSSSDAATRCHLHVSYVCTPPPWPGHNRRVCPRGDGQYKTCPVRIAERPEGRTI